MKIIISGGGTGGHIFPAIAIADAIKKIEPKAEILFVGAEGKMEMERVPKAGYSIIGLPVVGFQRKLTLKNLLFPIKLFNSLMKARKIVKDFRPDVAVGVGGYASGPILQMAMRKGVKGLVQEQNSHAGVTNKLLAERAQKICVAYDGMEKYFPNEKIILTGNPVRSDIWQSQATKEEALSHFGLDKNKKTILIIGGSLGARTINDAMRDNVDLLKNRTDIQVFWQCGKLYVDEFTQCETANLTTVKMNPFIDRMDLAYKMADVVISRAGALSISELCLVAKPAILVPSPNVAEDHQTKNAMALVNKNAAIMVKDIDAKQEMLQKAIEILDNPTFGSDLSKNIYQLAKPNAAETIAKEVLKLV